MIKNLSFRELLTKHKYYCLLAGLFIAAELIVFPSGNYPLNDDGTYAKAIRKWMLEDVYNIGTSSSSLWTHLMWGMLFTKLFGFSFVVLRFSTLISSLIGLTVLFRLVRQISSSERLAFVAALVLLFNPIYFNLSNTYMTDVNFNTLIICCCYFAHQFFKTKNIKYLILFFAFSILLSLLRQFGLLFPLCFTIACLFRSDKKWMYALCSLALTGLVVGVFKYYEHYIEVNKATDGYPFSGKIALFSDVFWAKIKESFIRCYKLLPIHVMVFPFAFVSVFLFSVFRESRVIIALAILALLFPACFFFFRESIFPWGNVFVNMSVGTETFYQRMNPHIRGFTEHTHNNMFAEIIFWMKIMLPAVFLALLCCLSALLIRKRKVSALLQPMTVFLAASFFIYSALLLLVSETYFDRYHIPLFTLLIIGTSYLHPRFRANYLIASVFLIFMFYASVFGTKDYFTLNNKRWEAYRYLRFEKGVAPERINAGVEPVCWHDGKPFIYYLFIFVDSNDYLIQYRNEPGFKVYKTYGFQRYFPCGKDSISIFVREKMLAR